MATKTRRSTTNSREAYTDAVNDIESRLTKIRGLIQGRAREVSEREAATGKGANWAHVGSMVYIREGLDAVVRQLTGEEE